MALDQLIEFYDSQSIRKSIYEIPDQVISHKKMNINYLTPKKIRNLNFGKKVYQFYNAPITKFWQNSIMYLIFLKNFTYIVLVKTPPTPSYSEMFVLVYIFTYGFDKLRELVQINASRVSIKMKIFFSKVTNILDMFFIGTVFVAIGFRLSVNDDVKVGRLIYCVNTIYWYVQSMEYVIVNKNTGPLLIISSKMVKYI